MTSIRYALKGTVHYVTIDGPDTTLHGSIDLFEYEQLGIFSTWRWTGTGWRHPRFVVKTVEINVVQWP